jgi:hypothetical protein
VRKVEVLAGRAAELDNLIRLWEAKMDDPAIVDSVARKLAGLNTERKAVAAELADAHRDAASPLAETWGEFRSLAELLAEDPSDELRVKVRAALRRAIESVHCLFMGTHTRRLAAVRVQFRGTDRHRDYVLSGVLGGRRPAKLEDPVSFADAGLGGFDLRQPADAAVLEKALMKQVTREGKGRLLAGSARGDGRAGMRAWAEITSPPSHSGLQAHRLIPERTGADTGAGRAPTSCRRPHHRGDPPDDDARPVDRRHSPAAPRGCGRQGRK